MNVRHVCEACGGYGVLLYPRGEMTTRWTKHVCADCGGAGFVDDDIRLWSEWEADPATVALVEEAQDA